MLIGRNVGWFAVCCGGMLLIVLMTLFPQQGMQSALLGLSIWWDVLFPALLPFFVISEVLLGLGIVHFLGTLLDPIMRPLFRVPGIGGFVMAMGLVSGYPVGARLTSQLWEQKLLSREEGERLVAFTTTADPIFLIGAVAIGFFHSASLATLFVISHYGASFIVGFLMRFHGRSGSSATRLSETPRIAAHRASLFTHAIQAMHRARLADGRPLGELLKQAIEVSLKLVFIIGGLVVLFAVAIELLTLVHVMDALYALAHWLLPLLGIPSTLSVAFVNGLFEVTLGAKFAGMSQASGTLIHQVALASFILSWGGLSVHAQIVSMLSHTTMRYAPFVVARLLHGIIAFLLIYLLNASFLFII